MLVGVPNKSQTALLPLRGLQKGNFKKGGVLKVKVKLYFCSCLMESVEQFCGNMFIIVSQADSLMRLLYSRCVNAESQWE